MKKLLAVGTVLILTVSMLAACGGDGKPGNISLSDNSTPPALTDSGGNINGGNNTNTPTPQDKRIIKPSELIGLEDAMRILGMELRIYGELDEAELLGGLRSAYEFDDGNTHSSPTYMLQINIRQDELLDEKDFLDKQMKARGGISFFNISLKEGVELISGEDDPMKTIWIEGIGDWACIVRSPIHTLNFAYGTYSVGITITGQATDASRNKEEESAWKAEKLIETAMLAVERLKDSTK